MPFIRIGKNYIFARSQKVRNIVKDKKQIKKYVKLSNLQKKKHVFIHYFFSPLNIVLLKKEDSRFSS